MVCSSHGNPNYYSGPDDRRRTVTRELQVEREHYLLSALRKSHLLNISSWSSHPTSSRKQNRFCLRPVLVSPRIQNVGVAVREKRVFQADPRQHQIQHSHHRQSSSPDSLRSERTSQSHGLRTVLVCEIKSCLVPAPHLNAGGKLKKKPHHVVTVRCTRALFQVQAKVNFCLGNGGVCGWMAFG